MFDNLSQKLVTIGPKCTKNKQKAPLKGSALFIAKYRPLNRLAYSSASGVLDYIDDQVGGGAISATSLANMTADAAGGAEIGHGLTGRAERGGVVPGCGGGQGGEGGEDGC